MIKRSTVRFVSIFCLLSVFSLPVFPNQVAVDEQISGLHIDESMFIRSPLDLQVLLRYWQQMIVPQQEIVLQDAGVYLFAPDSAGAELFFGALLADPGNADASVVYVSDDAFSGHTLFADLLGDVVSSLPADGLQSADGLTIRVSLVPLWPFFGWGNLAHETDEPTASNNLSRSKSVIAGAANGVQPEQAETSSQWIEAGLDNDMSDLRNSDAADEDVGTVYVHQKEGNDSWSGRAAFAKGMLKGPKKSVRGGLNMIQSGDTLIICEGLYAEGLDLQGKNIRVRIRGAVKLTN